MNPDLPKFFNASFTTISFPPGLPIDRDRKAIEILFSDQTREPAVVETVNSGEEYIPYLNDRFLSPAGEDPYLLSQGRRLLGMA